VHDVSIEERGGEVSGISFTIPGAPVGKGRPKFARRGNFVTAYTPEKTASYENLVKLAAAEAMQGRAVIDGAVSVWIGLYVTPPASWSQKKRRSALEGVIFPTSKPDLDNCIKGIFDACNEIVWKDDKQAVELTVTKKYSESARAVVQVTTL
jgi:Holliday junction resolvase RusA-like endonuclease